MASGAARAAPHYGKRRGTGSATLRQAARHGQRHITASGAAFPSFKHHTRSQHQYFLQPCNFHFSALRIHLQWYTHNKINRRLKQNAMESDRDKAKHSPVLIYVNSLPTKIIEAAQWHPGWLKITLHTIGTCNMPGSIAKYCSEEKVCDC